MTLVCNTLAANTVGGGGCGVHGNAVQRTRRHWLANSTLIYISFYNKCIIVDEKCFANNTKGLIVVGLFIVIIALVVYPSTWLRIRVWWCWIAAVPWRLSSRSNGGARELSRQRAWVWRLKSFSEGCFPGPPGALNVSSLSSFSRLLLLLFWLFLAAKIFP